MDKGNNMDKENNIDNPINMDNANNFKNINKSYDNNINNTLLGNCNDDFPVNLGECISSDFLVDLIFIEEETEKKAYSFSIGETITDEIKTIVDRTPKKFCDQKITVFMGLGMCVTMAMYCDFMNYSYDEARQFLTDLNTLGVEPCISNSTSECISDYNSVCSETSLSKDFPCRIENYKIINSQKINKVKLEVGATTSLRTNRVVNIKLKTVSFIPEKKLEMPIKSIKKRLFAKNKKRTEQNAEPEKIALRPLHWETLSTNDLTIFQEIRTIDSQIDFKEFERFFCKEIKDESEKEIIKEKTQHVDTKDIFLISLALKHLEIRQITPYSLSKIIRDNPDKLEIDDLMNIERVLLKKDDFASLLGKLRHVDSFCKSINKSMGRDMNFYEYNNKDKNIDQSINKHINSDHLQENQYIKNLDSSKTDSIEETIVKFNQIEGIRENVEILIFKKKFAEDFALLENLVGQFTQVFRGIISSQALKILLKIVLDIGNAINATYARKRKISVGYKIEGLVKCLDYTGRNNTKISDFIIALLRKRGVAPIKIAEDLGPIDTVKKEEFTALRDQINGLISLYKERLAVFAIMNETDKMKYADFLSNVSESLHRLMLQYRKCQDMSGEIVIKFGEVDPKAIDKIISVLVTVVMKLVKVT